MLDKIAVALLSLRYDRRGASAIEYSLIAAGAALAIAAFIPDIRTNIGLIFAAIRTQLIAVAPT